MSPRIINPDAKLKYIDDDNVIHHVSYRNNGTWNLWFYLDCFGYVKCLKIELQIGSSTQVKVKNVGKIQRELISHREFFVYWIGECEG